MKVTSETLPERQVLLEIQVDDERHSRAIEQAYKRLAPRVRIPGFRPGKAPRPLIERQLGRHRLLDEAMDILIPEVYKQAIEEESLDPVAGPSLELVSHEPFVIKATVPLRPEIDLGAYPSVRVPRETVVISDEQLEAAITTLRRRYGTVEPVDRPAAKGDIIRGDITAEVDGKKLFEQKEVEYRLTDESLATLPGLADHVVGLEKGADVRVQVKVADDFEDPRLAAKVADYHIVVGDVKEEKLAPLDDSFAKEVGEGFADLAALRDRVRSDLLAAEEDGALHRYHDQVIDALLEQAKTEFPSVLVEREIDRILEEEANLDARDPRAQELYLARLGRNEQEVRDQVRPGAELRLRRSLVLSQFAEAENITVTDQDIEAELQKVAASAGEQSESILRIFGSEAGRDSLRRTILTRRTLERLVEIASSDSAAAEPAVVAAAPKRPAKRSRAAPRQA